MSGRYDSSQHLTHRAGGRCVTYLAPRIVPAGDAVASTLTTTVAVGERHRLDLVAGRTLGNPRLAWCIADANDAIDPFDLCEHPGDVLRLPGSSL